MLPLLPWLALLVGSIVLLNVWHARHLAPLTPKEREDDHEALNCELQQW